MYSTLPEEIQQETDPKTERSDSDVSMLSSLASRPSTCVPAPSENHLEAPIYDALVRRKQAIMEKEILSLVFVMTKNSRDQEVVGIFN